MAYGFELKIETDNAAFADDYAGEVARIIREAADKVERGYSDGQLYDVNGNRVGSFWLAERADEDGEEG